MYNLPEFPSTPDSFAKKVQQAVKEGMEGENMGKRGNSKIVTNGWKKKAAAAAITLTLIGAGGLTVYAVANSAVKARMEHMPQEEKTELIDEAYASGEEGSSYSRELRDEEKERFYELRVKYQTEETFPEGELNRIEAKEDAGEDRLCYLPETREFFLPERELTDEEMLQIIDWQTKSSYALTEDYEKNHPEEVTAREEEKEKAKQTLEEAGGLDENGAREKASQWLGALYGKTEENMEVSAYVDTNGTGTPENPVYEITFDIAGVEMYNFSLNAFDGELCGVAYSGQEVQMGEMSVSDLESKVDSLKETAEKYLRDSFGISGNYKETYYSYSIGEGKDTVIMNMVTFQFMMEDDTVYIITLDGKSGILELFKSRSMEEYQRSLEADKELREKGVVTYEAVKKIIE